MDKEKIFSNAFIEACKFIQKHPPVEIDFNDLKQLNALAGSGAYEEGWKQWANYFLNKVIDQEEK